MGKFTKRTARRAAKRGLQARIDKHFGGIREAYIEWFTRKGRAASDARNAGSYSVKFHDPGTPAEFLAEYKRRQHRS